MEDDHFKMLLAQEGIVLPDCNTIPRHEGPRVAEASFSQMRIWMNQMLTPASTVYNTVLALQVDGVLSYASVVQALETVVGRHESLRTSFKVVDGRPFQEVRPFLAVDVKYVDLGATEESEQLLRDILESKSKTPFSLERGPLFDFTIVRVSDHRNALLFSLHHIIFDFVSSQVLFDEFSHLYERYTRGDASELAELPIQSLDYSEWQRKRFEREGHGESLDFWKAWLGTGDNIPALDLKGDQPPARKSIFSPAVEQFSIPAFITRQVQALSIKLRISRFVIWLAAFQMLLSRYSDMDDVVVCVPHAEREHPSIDRLIGFFVNFVPIKLAVKRQQCFRELLQTVHERYLEATGPRAYPFSKLVEQLSPRRDESGARLGNIGFGYQYSKARLNHFGPLRMRFLQATVPIAKSELALSVFEDGEACQAHLEYDGAKFSAHFMQTMANSYCDLLSQLLDGPERPVGSLELNPSSNARRGDEKDCDHPMHDCLHKAVAHQASTIPDSIALMVGDAHLSYGALVNRARHFASCLQNHHSVRPGDTVALYLPRNVDAYVCILALFQIGATYVPLELSNSPAYTSKLVRTATATHLIAMGEDDKLRAELVDTSLHVISLPALSRASYIDDDYPSRWPVTGVDTAYICFTSGSTGQSRGVIVSHQSIVEHVHSFVRQLGINAGDRILQFAALTFDVSIEQIFSAWYVGATLLPRGNEVWSAREFIGFLDREQVTFANPPTAYWNQVVAACADDELPCFRSPLRCLVAGGEAMLADTADRFIKLSDGRVRLVNAYGPTESVVTATLRDVHCEDINRTGTTVSIGHPLSGRRAYLLDRHALPVPEGAPGELCIAGVALAVGYHGNPRATAAQFWPEARPGSPNDDQPDSVGTRIYRSGDRVSRRVDGSLQYWCRKDDEVKIRGVRVSPILIESVLAEHPGLLETAVVISGVNAQSAANASSTNVVTDTDLAVLLEQIPEAVIERCLSEIEHDSSEVNDTVGTTKSPDNRRIIKRTSTFDLTLDLKDDRFTSTARPAQRNWLLNRALDECVEDIGELHILVQRLVAGSDRVEIDNDLAEAKPEYSEGQLIMAGQQVMQGWQRPLMNALSRAVCTPGGDILEVGFGMGISAGFIQDYGVRSHVILESNEAVLAEAQCWRKRYPHANIQLVHARWQDVIDELGEFDGVLFDTYPATEDEFRSHVLRDATFAAHFFPHAAKHLKDGGAFTYYSNEVDCLSRRHQRKLLAYFASFEVSVVRDLHPPRESQNWWADSMAVVRACKQRALPQTTPVKGEWQRERATP